MLAKLPRFHKVKLFRRKVRREESTKHGNVFSAEAVRMDGLDIGY